MVVLLVVVVVRVRAVHKIVPKCTMNLWYNSFWINICTCDHYHIKYLGYNLYVKKEKENVDMKIKLQDSKLMVIIALHFLYCSSNLGIAILYTARAHTHNTGKELEEMSFTRL